MKVWLKNSDTRVIMIEELGVSTPTVFSVFLDLSDEEKNIEYVCTIPRGLKSKSPFLDQFHLADKALEDFYLTVLR